MSREIEMDKTPPVTESVTYGVNLQVLEDKEVYDSADNYDPHSFYVWKKTTSTLWSFLSETLDPVNRDIVLRRVVDEQSFVAIGKLYGLSSDAIRERYLKSMRKLRRRIHRDEYEYINNIHLNFILDDIEYLPTTLDAENLDQYKQYMIRNPKPRLVKPVKPAKPKVKKRKKKVVVTEPVEQEQISTESAPTDTDESPWEPELPEFIEEYIPKSVCATVSSNMIKANGYVQFYRSLSGISRIMLCSSLDRKILFIDDVRIDLCCNLVRIGAHRVVSEEWVVDVGLHDFLDVLGIDVAILSGTSGSIKTAILESLQYPNAGWLNNMY